jgi:hypothetical protein
LTELVRTRRDRDMLLISHSPGVKRRPTKVDADDEEAKPATAKSPTFVDRQLQKAIDYVTKPTEQAKADVPAKTE